MANKWHETPSGVRFRLLEQIHSGGWPFKDTVAAYFVHIPVRVGFDVRLRNQGPYDALAISLGISSEKQIGDPDFDSAVFIECDDHVAAGLWLGSDRIRATVRNLLSADVTELIANDDGLWLKFDGDIAQNFQNKSSPEEVLDALHETIDMSCSLAKKGVVECGLPELPVRKVFGKRWGVVIPFLPLLCTFLFVPKVYMRGLVVPYQSVVWDYLLGLVFVSIALWFAWLWLGPRRSMRHRKAVWVAAGFYMAAASCFAVFANMNRWLDSQPGQAMSVGVRDTRHVRNGKGPDLYEVEVRDWRKDRGYFWVEVAWDEYVDAQNLTHSCLTFELSTGAFGYQYMKDQQVAARPAEGGCRALMD